MDILYYIILIASTLVFTALAVAGVGLLLNWLQVIDSPNERSNHTLDTPTGAGIAISVILIGFLTVANAPGNMLVAALFLAGLSFLDDMRGLPVKIRLGMQAVAIVWAVTAINGSITQGFLPYWAEVPLVMLAWLWFTNLYNFMDGIDEITITETASIGLGLVCVGLAVPELPRSLSIDGVLMATAVLAFYPFNRHPARLFMGDSGSVPLGFITAFLLLQTAAAGYWSVALILPAYYIADASFTLIKRAAAGEKIWQAHSQHCYQKAARNGWRHDDISRHILALNMVLIMLAALSSLHLYAAIGCTLLAYLLAGGMMRYLARAKPKEALHELAG
ncbi:MAG: hypothetical protein CMM94_07200 [Rickettsiales bacterium]|nr:hypothetical protein [Rickettsiales bacterium]